MSKEGWCLYETSACGIHSKSGCPIMKPCVLFPHTRWTEVYIDLPYRYGPCCACKCTCADAESITLCTHAKAITLGRSIDHRWPLTIALAVPFIWNFLVTFSFFFFFYEVHVATTGPATFWPTPLVHELGILGKFVLVHVQYLLLCNYIISTLLSIQEAEERHLKAIEIKERLLGRDDYEVALSVGHLASLYNYDMKKYPEAEKLYLRSIAIGKLVYWHLNILFHLCCMSSNLFCCLKANIQVDYC